MSSTLAGVAPAPESQMPTSIEETGNCSVRSVNQTPTEECGVVWFGLVPPDQFFEMTPFFLSLQHVRPDKAVHDGGLDIHFFADGPNAGEGFVCLDTLQSAQELVDRFPRSIMIGPNARFPVWLQLSTQKDLELAQQNYTCQFKEGHARTPTPPVVAKADAAPRKPEKEGYGDKSLVYWLRGIPFEATQADIDSFLKPIQGRYRQLDVGHLITGECSGNIFVEMNSPADRDAIMRLHNTFIDIEATSRLQPMDRPKPRFVEVIAANAQRRTELLEHDARSKRKPQAGQRHLQPRAGPRTTQSGASSSTSAAGASATSAAAAQAQAPPRPSVGSFATETLRDDAIAFLARARTKTSPLPTSPSQHRSHQHQPQQQQHQQQQQFPPTYTRNSPPLAQAHAQQPFSTITMYTQSPAPPLPAAFQYPPLQQPQQQFAVALHNTTQIPYIPQQRPRQQEQQQQDMQPQCYYLIQGTGLNSQHVLMNPGSFTQLNMTVNPTAAPAVSLLSVNPANGYYNANVVAPQQALPPTTFSLVTLPSSAMLPQLQPQPQPPLRFIITPDGQSGLHLQPPSNFFISPPN